MCEDPHQQLLHGPCRPSQIYPAFVTHLVTLCKNWPEQKRSQSIFDFDTEFTAFVRLHDGWHQGFQFCYHAEHLHIKLYSLHIMY